MERDTASLVTGKKGGREEEEGEIETAEKRIRAEMRMLWTDRWTVKKMGWA